MNKRKAIIILPLLYASLELLQYIMLGGILVSHSLYLSLMFGGIAVLCEIGQYFLLAYGAKLGIAAFVQKYSIKNKFINDYSSSNMSYT